MGVDGKFSDKPEFKKCLEETGADPEVMMKLRKGEEATADDKIKCFHACIMKAHGSVSYMIQLI